MRENYLFGLPVTNDNALMFWETMEHTILVSVCHKIWDYHAAPSHFLFRFFLFTVSLTCCLCLFCLSIVHSSLEYQSNIHYLMTLTFWQTEYEFCKLKNHGKKSHYIKCWKTDKWTIIIWRPLTPSDPNSCWIIVNKRGLCNSYLIVYNHELLRQSQENWQSTIHVSWLLTNWLQNWSTIFLYLILWQDTDTRTDRQTKIVIII